LIELYCSHEELGFYKQKKDSIVAQPIADSIFRFLDFRLQIESAEFLNLHFEI